MIACSCSTALLLRVEKQRCVGVRM